MPSCIFHVGGPNFEVDAYLASSGLVPYQVFHIGTPRGWRGRLHDRSGFKIHVCDGEGIVARQEVEALTFLRSHQTDLARLATWPEVTHRYLNFGYWRREVLVQSEFLSPDLLALAGSLGIGILLSMYPPQGQNEADTFAKD